MKYVTREIEVIKRIWMFFEECVILLFKRFFFYPRKNQHKKEMGHGSSKHSVSPWRVAWVLLLIFGLLCIVLVVVAPIRNLLNGNQRTRALESLLEKAKTQFTSASKEFGTLDETYISLDTEFETVVTNAADLGAVCDKLNSYADDTTKEFEKVTTSFTKMETSYNSLSDEYGLLASVTGLLYIAVGSEENGMEVTVQRFGYSSGHFETYIPEYIPPVANASAFSRYVYKKNANGYVDCFEVLNESMEKSDAKPVLHARDMDGSLSTISKEQSIGISSARISNNTPAIIKYLQFNVCIIDQKLYVVSITAFMANPATSSGTGYETFVVDRDVYNTYNNSGQIIKAVAQQLICNNMYVLNMNGAGALDLVMLTYREKAELEKTPPSYSPTVFNDLKTPITRYIADISTSVALVSELANKRSTEMDKKTVAIQTIRDSNTVRKQLRKNHDKTVEEFNNLSVNDLKLPEDIFDKAGCTIM
jgi:hypothetical protein